MNDTIRVQWGTLFVLVVFHVGFLAAPFFFSWWRLCIFLTVWFVGGCLGTNIGLHRYLTHRSFKISRKVRNFLIICATLLLQDPIRWVASHIPHHIDTEGKDDPHSPRKGVFMSHIGWVFLKDREKHDSQLQKYGRALLRDPFCRVMHKIFWVPSVLLGIILFAFGGLGDVLWFVAAIAWCWHCMWLVNSAGHMWGYRNFDTSDDSRNNWLVAIIALGEGWHNNHHEYSNSPRHGLKRNEIDFTWGVIRVMLWLGIASAPKLPNA